MRKRVIMPKPQNFYPASCGGSRISQESALGLKHWIRLDMFQMTKAISKHLSK